MTTTQPDIQEVLNNMESLATLAKQHGMPQIAITTEQAQSIVDFCRSALHQKQEEQ